MYITVQLKNLFKMVGITIDRYPTGDLRRRKLLFNYYRINLIFDVGANKGQYVSLLRQLGYKGRFVSFEPLEDAFTILKKKSFKDPNWVALKYAVGESNSIGDINVSHNSVSSSFLDMLPIHTEESPESVYVNKETVDIISIDSIFNDYYNKTDNVLLKIDTQGFEKQVLKGAEKSFDYITGIQMEMCLSETYKDETPFIEMISYLAGFGFKLFSIEPGYFKKVSGQLYQADGIFFKEY
ncbi:hypothetical protein ES705_50802 [subsurface metagenome]